MYAIMKGGKYVALPGRRSSYTDDPDYAQKFTTEDEARRNACGNEVVIKLTLAWR